jgi:hypothetical protein
VLVPASSHVRFTVHVHSAMLTFLRHSNYSVGKLSAKLSILLIVVRLRVKNLFSSHGTYIILKASRHGELD